MRKMGEAQIIDFFSSYLKDVLHCKFGAYANYSVGNFSGSQDRKFSDFFAGTDSHNILIEFKEKKEECAYEGLKPLRERLCDKLDDKISGLSRECHFIGWGTNHVTTVIELNPYIDLICRIFNQTDYLLKPTDKNHETFVQNFIDGKIGVDQDSFVKYIEHLNNIAGGSASGTDIPFRSILYSRNENGLLVGTRFENLGELIQLRNMRTRKLGPTQGGASSGPSGGMKPRF